MLQRFIEQLRAAQSLTDSDVRDGIVALTDASVATELKADFLAALAHKGETTDEIAAFATELRARAVEPPLDDATHAGEILDVCGTGGDRLNTFNISTTVAIVAAAAGIRVAKHGNRAITSQAGSADVLEALGVRIDLPPAETARCLRERRFAFFFAQQYHPAFQHIGPARKLCAARGQRTIFNFLGPLLNPAKPSAQLVGVPRPSLCEPLARVLQRLGVRRAMVVSGSVETKEAWLDEFSTLGENTVAEFYQDRGFATSTLGLEHFPIQRATLADLAGGNCETNAGIIREILAGRERGPKRDAVLLNAAAALFVAGRSRTLTEGWDHAAELIDRGDATAKLEELASPWKQR